MNVREGHSEWPDLMYYSDIPMFNTKAVVQQTGVPAPTLRAWERRYTLLSPERAANNDYRLYSERDIVMIRWLKEHVDAGMSISQAIALFRHTSEAYTQLREEQKLSPELIEEHSPAFYVALPESLVEEHEGQLASPPTPLQTTQGTRLTPDVAHPPDYKQVVYNMQRVSEHVLDAFKVLDETTAGILMASMLAIYTVEQVCSELIVPTLWQIGQLWEEGKISVSVEHFASAYFRGLLTNLFHVAHSIAEGPLVLVCCAPGEPHEIAPLMLALFLRRAGMRVAYLGQSIESAGLLQTIQQLAPAVVCISLTMPAYLASLIDLAQQIAALAEPRPLFAFGGQVFIHYKHLISQVPGTYINGDLQASITEIGRILSQRAES